MYAFVYMNMYNYIEFNYVSLVVSIAVVYKHF